jgi:hypothetical protein
LFQRPVTPVIAITVPHSKWMASKFGVGKRSIVPIGLFCLIIELACAWHPELQQDGAAGRNDRALAANTSGEHYGEMTPETLERFKAEIRAYWQTPYLWGGNAPSGVDCSGLVDQIYKNAAAIELPRTTIELFSSGMTVQDQPLQFADLVFFRISRSRQPDHVGFYVARGFFIHASVRSGVSLSLISEKPYCDSYAGARRFLK